MADHAYCPFKGFGSNAILDRAADSVARLRGVERVFIIVYSCLDLSVE